MIDLERLLTDRRDQLRGRPEDWIDRFGYWRRSTDWLGVGLVVGALVWATLVMTTVLWLSR